MNRERAIMKSKLAAAETGLVKKVKEAESFLSAIHQQTNTAITPVLNIPIADLDAQMDELVMVYAEMAAIRGDIERLKNELGD